MTLLLRVDGDTLPTGEFEATGGVRIGRGRENDLVLPEDDMAISKQHCEITLGNDGYVLVDRSRNGTYLNGKEERVPPGEPVRIGEGDVLRIGALRITLIKASVADWSEMTAARPATGWHTPPPTSPPSLTGNPFADWDDAVSPRPGLSVPEEFDERAPAPSHRPASFPDHVPATSTAFVQPRLMGEVIPEDWDLAAELPPPPAAARLMAPPPTEAPQPEAAPPPPPQAQGPILAFLQASGLPALLAASPELEAVMTLAGSILARSVTELHGLLSARRLAKQEFGVERTMVARSANNPMKFTVDPRDVLPLLLAPGTPGLLAGDAAIDQAFDDLKAHQLSMLAGLQAALASVCEQLAPPAIAALAEPSPWHRFLPQAEAAARWAAYQRRFAEVVARLDTDMAALLGADFTHAYRRGAEGTGDVR